MRILWSWLAEFVDLAEAPSEVAERLTRAGLEVEGISPYRRLPEALQSIVVGEVVAQEKHPAADRLQVCRVRVAPDKEVTIVTGASNTHPGAKVPVALPGSRVLMQGQWVPLEARSFRGIRSEGMLCSEVELGLGPDAEGIYLLPPEAPIGAPLTSVLEDYTDTTLEVSATPNRGDALSHLGIAREYAALVGGELRLPEIKIHGARPAFPLQIVVGDSEAIPRYGGLYITGLEGLLRSPAWLRHRLEAVGLRSIHPIVDVTNYVLIGYGQPLHAFDAERLMGSQLRVYPLEGPAQMESLQGQLLSLQAGDIVIADAAGPACLGGLVGGKRTAVQADTRAIFLESAYFSPRWIRATARRLGLHTESGYRFMRGTDPGRVPWAAELAASLLQQLYPDAEVSQFAEVHAAEHTAPRKVIVSLAQLRQVTALPLPAEATRSRLARLDIAVKEIQEEVWELEVPHYRLDVTRPADIAEELLRLEGWGSLPRKPLQPPTPYARPSAVDGRYRLREALSEFLTGLGFWEIRTNSLVGAHHFLPESALKPIRLANPLYEELAYLRPTLIGSGLEVLAHNRNHGAQGFWAYEWGKIYHAEGESERLALWGWGRPPFHSLGKGQAPLPELLARLRAFFSRLGMTVQEAPLTAPSSVWLEGLQLSCEGAFMGVVGYLSEAYLKRFHLGGQRVACAELDPLFWEASRRRLPSFQQFSYHPIVVKDLSVFLSPGLVYAQLVTALLQLKHPYLQRIEPFDRYTDPTGRPSYGLRLYLQANHTLSEGEIQDFLHQAIAALEAIGAEVRKAEAFAVQK